LLRRLPLSFSPNRKRRKKPKKRRLRRNARPPNLPFKRKKLKKRPE